MFLIDWEKTKGKITHHLTKGDSTTTLDSTAVKEAPVSVWRMISVANQWQSIQVNSIYNVFFNWEYAYIDISQSKCSIYSNYNVHLHERIES